MNNERKEELTQRGREYRRSIPDSADIMKGARFPKLNSKQKMAVLVRLPAYLASIRRKDSGNDERYQQPTRNGTRPCGFTEKQTNNLFNFLLTHFSSRAENAAMVHAIGRGANVSFTYFFRTDAHRKWISRHRDFLRGMA